MRILLIQRDVSTVLGARAEFLAKLPPQIKRRHSTNADQSKRPSRWICRRFWRCGVLDSTQADQADSGLVRPRPVYDVTAGDLARVAAIGVFLQGGGVVDRFAGTEGEVHVVAIDRAVDVVTAQLAVKACAVLDEVGAAPVFGP